MDVRDILFPNYPRMFGNPKAFLINNREELNRNAGINSNENDKNFASVCSYNSDGIPIFEILFFETDDYTPEPVRKVVLWFESHKIPWICLLSGNRGFHLHGLFKSEYVNQKTVKKFANLILEETGMKEYFDSHVSGVLEKLCRIPNTQRLGNGWCVPILRKELFEINDPQEFKKLCSTPRFIDFEIGERPSIYNFISEDTSEDKPVQIVQVSHPKEVFFLKQILRPCVYKALLTPNPKHDFRLSSVVEMFNHGLLNKQIFNIYEKLNHIDFEHGKTHYQIDFIEEKRKNGEMMIPPGKKKLGCTKKGSCLKCILES